MTSFFRYPGGKNKLKKIIIDKLLPIDSYEYIEPFFGGGSIGLELLFTNKVKKLWINDKDIGIACLWTSIINYPELLKSKINSFIPSIEYFDLFKNKLKSISNNQINYKDETIEYGFMKLTIHQISYSGLGVMSGGPLGGRKEGNIAGVKNEVKYPIDCRWSPTYLLKKIDKIHHYFSQVKIKENKCTCLDFSEVLINTEDHSIIYLDPPYFVKGEKLYQYSFNIKNHVDLCNYLKINNNKWILSYDNCLEVKELYNWAKIEEILKVNYSIKVLKDKETGKKKVSSKSELLISQNFI